MLLYCPADSHTGPYFRVFFCGRHHTSYCVTIKVSFGVEIMLHVYLLTAIG